MSRFFAVKINLLLNNFCYVLKHKDLIIFMKGNNYDCKTFYVK